MNVHNNKGPHKSHSFNNNLLSLFLGNKTYLNFTQTAFKSLITVCLIGSSNVLKSGWRGSCVFLLLGTSISPSKSFEKSGICQGK